MSFNFSQTAGTSGETSIVISATSTSDIEDRIENYTIANNSGNSVVMSVMQKAYVPTEKYINLYPSSITWDGSGGTASLQIQSNDDWVITSNSWIELSRFGEADRGFSHNTISGNGNTIIGIRALENTGTTRNGGITGHCISNSAISATTTVVQNTYTEPYIQLSYYSINCDSTGTTSSFTISSNVDWYIVVSERWTSVNTESGSGDVSITFTVGENTSSLPRSCDITVYARNYDIKVSLAISQDATQLKPYITLIPDRFVVSDKGSTGNTIHVSANCSYDITTETDWITLHSSSGSGDGTVTFDTDPAPLVKFNTGLIEFSNSALSRTVTVERQGEEPYLYCDKSTIALGFGSGTTEFYVYSNVDWDVKADFGDGRDWFSVTPEYGKLNDKVVVNYDSSSIERTGSIIVTNTTYGISFIITIMQLDSSIIYYTTVNGETAMTFGMGNEYPSYFYDRDNNELSLVSNTYSDGLGRMKFNGEIYTIKERMTVTQSFWYAFYHKTEFTSFILPDSINAINHGTFSGCSNLNSIILPSSNFIGTASFPYCSSLTGVAIPDTVRYINFCGCTSLVEVDIPQAATGITENCFSGCSLLTSIELGDNIQTIGGFAFIDCSGLTEITIPSGVTSLGRGVFMNTSIMEIFMYPTTAPSVIETTYSSQSGWRQGTFSGLPKGGKLHYPAGSNYSSVINAFNSWNTGNNWTFVGDL